MQTNFTPEQLKNSAMATSEKILRSCVHCGFCTATCPTYLLLGDERDSPRGRIYQIKEMFENDRPADAGIVTHLDRCLSCLSCMTTCPSGVHYMHLIDHARAHIEQTYTRPLPDRLMRNMLAAILPYPNRMRAALALGSVGKTVLQAIALILPRAYPNAAATKGVAKPITGLSGLMKRSLAMLELVPRRLPSRSAHDGAGVHAPLAETKGRVLLLQGCAQRVLDPDINDAAIRVLTRLGYQVVLANDEGCCGALVHHMGHEQKSHAQVKHNIDVWMREVQNGLDAIIITASGCGTTIKDYGFMLRDDARYAEKAAKVSSLAKDVSEFLVGQPLKAVIATGQNVTYHSACSMQHGQKITDAPKILLKTLGFNVKDVPEGHICCGSAGTYNILQPDLAASLGERKVANILRTKPDFIAAGNLGCMTQIGKSLTLRGASVPLVHTLALVDWALGGPHPSQERKR